MDGRVVIEFSFLPRWVINWIAFSSNQIISRSSLHSQIELLRRTFRGFLTQEWALR